MRTRFALPISVLVLFAANFSFAQTPGNNVQARNTVSQVLDTSGYSSNPIPGFTASGTIIYFSGSGPQEGQATIRARGFDQFRIDANLPKGIKTVSFNRSGGTGKDPSGRREEFPAHSTLVAINPIFPYLELANALASSNATVSYQGSVPEGNRQYYRIRTRRSIPREHDALGKIEDLTQVDYLIDIQTSLVARIESIATSITNMDERFPQVIDLANYTGKSGIAVPTSIRLSVAGNTMWELQLTNLAPNSTLGDEDFTVR